MAADFVPTREADLLSFSKNFSAKISASPGAYGLSSAESAEFSARLAAFQSQYSASRNPDTRTPSVIFAKRTAKTMLIAYIRELARIVRATPAVTDLQKRSLGLHVRDAVQSVIGPPQHAPQLRVTAVAGRTVHFRLSDSSTPTRRGRPRGVAGAMVFTHIGPDAPASNQWEFAGQFTRMKNQLQFPMHVPEGAKLWLTAFWYNAKGQSGKPCDAVTTYIQGGNTMIPEFRQAA